MRQRSRKHQLQKRIQRRRPKLRLKRYRQGSVGAQRESSETSKEGTVELWRLRPTRMKRIIMRKQEEGQEVKDAADVMETADNTEAEASFGSSFVPVKSLMSFPITEAEANREDSVEVRF